MKNFYKWDVNNQNSKDFIVIIPGVIVVQPLNRVLFFSEKEDTITDMNAKLRKKDKL